jgi:glycosyltransferase involved in cell wall biosynthesis
LIDRGIDAEAWFAGEERGGSGTFTDHLRQVTAELGLTDRVRWLGFRSDGPDLLRAADFFLLPSTHEGLPLSVLEAQASGTIALGAPIPGIAEVIEDGSTGFLIPPDAPDRYADAMAATLASPPRAEAIRAAALAAVRSRHSWDRYLSQVRSVYGAAMEG